MEVIIILISVSLGIALIFLAIFFWNVKSGQYDDTFSPSVRILFDDTGEADQEKDGQDEEAKNET